jgi:hypothetical protein
MSLDAESVGLMIVSWIVPFVLGLLFRKRVGRAIVNLKRWLFNDIVTADIVSIRTFVSQATPIEIHEFTQQVYDEAKVKILNPSLRDIFEDGMRVEIPTFGILLLNLREENKGKDVEEEENEEGSFGTIKMTLKPESSVRLGTREIQMLNDFYQTAEALFNAAEKLITTAKQINQDYTILEFSRMGRFVEEKTFEIDDKDVGAHVHATVTTLSLTVSPSSQITKAAKKYLLV